MKKVISISECIEMIPWENGTAELCASAEAAFDAAKKQVVVELDSFVSPIDIAEPGKKIRAPWLPAAKTLCASSEAEEATEVARDIFHNWVKCLRQAAPDPVKVV